MPQGSTGISRRMVLAGGVASAILPASAQVSGPVTKIIAPATPGGSTDILARMLATELAPMLGQSFVVENRAGAGTNIGNEYVARAAPDGQTLLILTIAATINRGLNGKLRYDPRSDFAPIAQLTDVPNMMVIGPTLMEKGIKDMAGFIAHAKENPGKYNYASNGIGTTLHLTGELFRMRTGIALQHVPFKGWPEAASSMLRGENHIMFDNVSTGIVYIKEGKTRALAVTSAQRSRVLPDVPTMAEAGVKDIEVVPWFGLAATKGSPPDVVAKLEAAVAKIMARPDIQKTIGAQGMDIAYRPAAEFSKIISTEVDRWMEISKASGVTLE